MSSKRQQLVLYRMCCCLWVFLGNDKVCTYMETLSRGTWLMVCAMCLQVFFGVGTLWAQDARLSEKHIRFQDVDRLYYLYMPDTLAQGNPLVVMLHGYGGNAAGLRPEMIETAARHGFALCIPQGEKDPKGKPSWNVRYPMQEGMTTDDVAFILHLVKSLQHEYGLSSRNVFLTGMSNGGEMCYIMAYLHPEAWGAIASVAGLTMEWLVREEQPRGAVPFMEIHGTEDRTSEWRGDPSNQGGWGAYLAVPIAVGAIVAANRCTHEESVQLPLLDAAKPTRPVVLHRYLGGTNGYEVRLYEVVGGEHTWHMADMDTLEEIWSFFSSYIR